MLQTLSNSEIGIDIPSVATNTTTITAEGTSYKLSDISFNFVKYDLPRAVTDAMTAVLASGSVYQYWFPSYTSFMGQPVNGSKTGTTRISLSTSSLEMLIGTFMVQNRDTQSFPLLGTHKTIMLHHYQQQNMELKIELFGQQYKIVLLCVLINQNILFVMEHH